MEVSDIPTTCPVYLTLSPLGRNAAESHLEINWGPHCSNPPIWIGLYRKDPSLYDLLPDYYVQTEESPAGNQLTDVVLGNLQLPGGWDRETASQLTAMPNGTSLVCLPFYVAAFNAGNRMQSLDCLKLQPHWMGNIQVMLDAPLRSLFIPGTNYDLTKDMHLITNPIPFIKVHIARVVLKTNLADAQCYYGNSVTHKTLTSGRNW